jgi:hypothetical protein
MNGAIKIHSDHADMYSESDEFQDSDEEDEAKAKSNMPKMNVSLNRSSASCNISQI